MKEVPWVPNVAHIDTFVVVIGINIKNFTTDIDKIIGLSIFLKMTFFKLRKQWG